MMLSAPWSLGHVFNPLSVYFALTPTGQVRWALLEVHNTYSGRHNYFVHPDAQGRAEVEKAFYVSPFFEVRGQYKVQVRLTDEQVLAVINLHQDGELVFSASFSGVPVAATPLVRALSVLRTPLVNQQTSLRIRIHGIWLWLRRLPVVPRKGRKEAAA